MDEDSGAAALEEEIAALEGALGGASEMAAGFSRELRRVHETFSATGQGAARLEASLSRGVARAIDGVVLNSGSLSGALRQIGRSLVDTAYSAAVKPVAGHVGGMLARGMAGIFAPEMPFARGGAFTQGRVMPFAQGGVVSGPVHFGMRGGGLGLMGEAGPEAILPLRRGADGRLGVASAEAGSARPVQVVMNIQTPDAESFRRSRAQIAAQVSRALAGSARLR